MNQHNGDKTAGTLENQCSMQPVIEVRKQFRSLLRERVAARLLHEQDAYILSLRLGLEDGKTYTLRDTARAVQKSPEAIRRRQYLALKRAMKDLRFFKILRDYAALVSLPRGVTYYLYRYSEDAEISQESGDGRASPQADD